MTALRPTPGATHPAGPGGVGPDLLGEGYEQRVLDLGPDPEGEGDVAAVLVRRAVRPDETVTGAALYVHGFSDYFFQTALADALAGQGLAFHALDLRKSGRARRPGQTAHHVLDLARYDEELDRALDVLAAEHPGPARGRRRPLDRRARRPAVAGPPAPRRADRARWRGSCSTARGSTCRARRTCAARSRRRCACVSRVRPLRAIGALDDVYGSSLHTSGTGEWDFDLALKPLEGFPVTAGWLNAVRRGQARLHRGLDVGVPSLVLRSDRTHYSRRYSEDSDRADTVLDVRQIARWAGCLGGETTVVPVAGARHDVFLSLPEPREQRLRGHGAVAARPRADGRTGLRRPPRPPRPSQAAARAVVAVRPSGPPVTTVRRAERRRPRSAGQRSAASAGGRRRRRGRRGAVLPLLEARAATRGAVAPTKRTSTVLRWSGSWSACQVGPMSHDMRNRPGGS